MNVKRLFNPYREPPKQEPAPEPVALPNELDRTFFDVEATFAFADERTFDLLFKHDEVPSDWVDGGAYLLASGPPHRSGEDHFDSYVHAAHQKGYFTFPKDGVLHVVPWHDFKGAVTRTVATRKVNITWGWRRDK